MIDVLRRQLRVRPVEGHRFQLEHDHRAGGVLGERLVDPHPDLGTGRHLSFDDVVGDELLRDVSTHAQCILADPAARGNRPRFSRDRSEGTKKVSYEPG